ncbi:hypothetical protein KRP22_008534 [Phytophthora ramorum]|uniref:uncharacterized protein n=1 Tax=Phytophthora ramorum TaxID=164328 RepID=UPI003099A36A|nr:hypothetical protein KRP23_2770 [Phytophthora ramorum]KAH7501891.1 hypothetical protein KRP22_7367 [Phytophthora ramorum]
MAGLDCPMQTKALNLFWHKAELRLVEQPQPEAPVFAISRPTLFGGREEFILQYPARLEPPTKRDLARHRFTVRHGKKRRSFQAPDAATFGTWLSALEQALEPKREPDEVNTPSSTATTATATSSQGRESIAGSTGTRASSRCRVSTLGGASSRASSNASVAMPPPSRITLERECFTRDPNNHKLLWLHRPAPTIAGLAIDEVERGDIVSLSACHEEAEEDYTNIFATEDAPLNTTDKCPHANSNTTEVFSDGPDAACAGGDHDQENGSCIAAVEDMQSVADVGNGEPLDDPSAANDVAGIELDNINSEVKAVVEGLVAAVSEGEQDRTIKGEEIDIVNESDAINPEIEAVVEALVAAVVKSEDGSDLDGGALGIGNATVTMDGFIMSGVESSRASGSAKEPAAQVSARSATLVTKHRWEPLDPTNSSLIWVRCSADANVHSAPRSNPRRRPSKPARKWVPVDPSSTRLIWIKRVENAAARIQSRYKATSNTRKWTPLEPDNSRFIWVRRQIVPVSSAATPLVDSSSFRV